MIHNLAVSLAVLVSLVTPADAGRAPRTFFDAVAGEWDGEGQLFGRPTRFTMSWEWELEARFVRLTYSILGESRMDAIAHYRVRNPQSIDGVWLDTRGEMLELSATVTDVLLETHWRSPTEEGRTTYERTGPDGLQVRDYFHDGTDWQLFGEARYTRALDSSTPTPGRGFGPRLEDPGAP